MKKYILSILLLSCVSFFLQCKSKPATETEKHAPTETENHEHEEGTVSFTKEQMEMVGIELGSITARSLSNNLKANGILKVPNQNQASIHPLYSGVIKNIMIEPGHFVKKGAVIATISNPEIIKIQSEYLNTIALLEKAEQEHNRQKTLYEGNAGALKNLQAAAAELLTLKNTKAAYAEQLRLMGISPSKISPNRFVSELSIISPISGTVSKINVSIGSFVSSGTEIAQITENNMLHLDLFVYEQDLPKLHNGQTIRFTLTNNPGREYEAKIFSLGSNFENESKAVAIHAEVMGDKTGLIDGMNVTAIIILEQQALPAVPNEALVNEQGKDYIFILEEDKHEHEHEAGAAHDHNHETEKKSFTFKKILVSRGVSDLGYTEINLLQDIPKDAKVVIKGAFFVQAKMNNTGEHGHAH